MTLGHRSSRITHPSFSPCPEETSSSSTASARRFRRTGTDFQKLGADELGRVAVRALLAKTALDPALVDEVIFGCVCQPPEAQNITRVMALRAGIPQAVPAMTVHRNCASGLEAITAAAERMVAGRGEIYIVGGMENMSRVPLLYSESATAKFAKLSRAKSLAQKLAAMAKFRPADFSPRVALMLGLTDPYSGLGMGDTAEILAREFGIPREEQDAFADRSQKKAVAAHARLAEEITPVFVDDRAIADDNGPRADSSVAGLAKLKPVFDRKYGSVTAGNSSQITDGACALLVMTERKAAELDYRPLGRLVSYAYAGCDPARMGLGPVPAIQRIGRPVADADLIEINEAFAAQTLAVMRRLDLSEEKLNVNGGAIALGHPVGVTGARLALTALLELRRRNQRTALISMCVGGGQGGAAWLERME